MRTDRIESPVLMLDKQKCLQNIRAMVEKARRLKKSLRPHFKTHQSAEIGEWFREAGVEKITVSSVEMAAYFAAHGWEDITIAFPVNIHQAEKINTLAQKIQLNILIVNVESFKHLQGNLTHQVGFFIEIDNGNHRSGILAEAHNEIERILETAFKNQVFSFKGFLEHAGHNYRQAGNISVICGNVAKSNLVAKKLKTQFAQFNEKLIFSYGDTPSFSLCDDFEAMDELRPGNAVFYDIDQYENRACSINEIAVSLACPIVAVYPQRSEVVIHGGSVHLSKDAAVMSNGMPYYGKVVRYLKKGWELVPGAFVSGLSQEHGIVRFENRHCAGFNVGSTLGVLPVHSCLTCDINPSYFTLEGDKIEKLQKGFLRQNSEGL